MADNFDFEDEFEPAEVYGYEVAAKPESAIHDGCIEFVVSKIWIKQVSKRGANEETRSITYSTPWGKETPVVVPFQDEYEVPEGMITLDNLEHAIRELLEMKDK